MNASKFNFDRSGGIPDWDGFMSICPESTVVLGDTQVLLLKPDDLDGGVYLANFYTRPESRLSGGANRLMRLVLDYCDREGISVYTHPDLDWLEGWLCKFGFINLGEYTEEGYPLMKRRPIRDASDLEPWV